MAAPTADLAVILGTLQPTCSIIIPVYNSEGVVGETIDQTT